MAVFLSRSSGLEGLIRFISLFDLTFETMRCLAARRLL
eukprot:CAMPEP_0180803550 /NCGR_PEP_ID=MMETSP1038_2-20121128/60958_1 /TAXON_ID=632150 /ORGANISM="Azadinium spinosum, Strain 3D9" /LENGTH=37 /DNA_ID= /DNA_START= /DNA_END= /DNA_ORIENTATION=